MGLQVEKGKTKADGQSREAASTAAFLWERQPRETGEAYRAYVLYRSQDPKTRSLDKCGVGHTMARRWARKWRWVTRIVEWEAWLVASQAELNETGQMRLRAAQLNFANRALAKAAMAVEAAKPSETTIEEAVQLAESGTKLGRQAVGLDVQRSESGAPGVSVSFGFAVPWLNGKKQNESETKLLVQSGEQVLGETPAIAGRTRLIHRVLDCPPDKGSPVSAESPITESAQIIEAPKLEAAKPPQVSPQKGTAKRKVPMPGPGK
jgi:hypothetical protein